MYGIHYSEFLRNPEASQGNLILESHSIQGKAQKNQAFFEKELSDDLNLWYRFARMGF